MKPKYLKPKQPAEEKKLSETEQEMEENAQTYFRRAIRRMERLSSEPPRRSTLRPIAKGGLLDEVNEILRKGGGS